MLTESEVIAATCLFLKSKGFRITQSLLETEHGVDIEAVAPDGKTKISIEAKCLGGHPKPATKGHFKTGHA